MSDDDPIGRRKNLAIQDPLQQVMEMMDQAKEMMGSRIAGQTVHLSIELTASELVEIAHLIRSMREPERKPEADRQDSNPR